MSEHQINKADLKKKLKEIHTKMFLEDLFEGVFPLKRVVFPSLCPNEIKEPIMPLTIIPNIFPRIYNE
jgi:hypothetical protein